jgi:ABC-2 type transport system permease protein
MSAALAITKREIRTYFNSPVPYIVAAVFMGLAGFMFFKQLFIEKQAEMRGYFGITPMLLTFIIPAVTMRLLAEEKGSGTLELLITMPVRDWEVVVGKFLAALFFVLVLLGLTFVYAVTVTFIGPLDKGPAYGGYFGLLLMGGAYAAIGLAASSLSRNQIVAWIVGFAICFALWLFGRIVQIVPGSLQAVMQFLSIESHFEAISRGVIDSRDIIYFVSIIVVSLVVATASLESRKWR